MAKVIVFSLIFIISQVCIFGATKGIDFRTKNAQIKKFQARILKLKQIEIKKRPRIITKNKVSLKAINKYQFRKDLNKENIPTKKITTKEHNEK